MDSSNFPGERRVIRSPNSRPGRAAAGSGQAAAVLAPSQAAQTNPSCRPAPKEQRVLGIRQLAGMLQEVTTRPPGKLTTFGNPRHDTDLLERIDMGDHHFL